MIDHLRSIVWPSWQCRDRFLLQTWVLARLPGYGIVRPDGAVSGMQTAVILVAVLLAQALCRWLWKLSTYDPRRPLLACLSLRLFLRLNILSLAILSAYLA